MKEGRFAKEVLFFPVSMSLENRRFRVNILFIFVSDLVQASEFCLSLGEKRGRFFAGARERR